MCPPTTHFRPDDIRNDCSNEEIFMILDKVISGSPLPQNVAEDINPFQYMPSNLPDGCWYLICSDVKKDAEVGIWKATGGTSLIFRNATIDGWRTTYEFHEGKSPDWHKTNWVMQEYWISKGMHGNGKDKIPRSLCRVFLRIEGNLNDGMQQNQVDQLVPCRDSNTISLSNRTSGEIGASGQGSTSKSQVNNDVDETKPIPVVERPLNRPEENHPEEDPSDAIASGNYLELFDLDIPLSPSSSTDNSSCLSSTSEQSFESFRDLESEDQKDLHNKKGDCKFSVLASAKARQLLICPPTVGSLIRGGEDMSPTQGAPSTPSPYEAGSSSKAVEGREKEAAGVKKRKLKKYCCFIPL